MAFAFTDQTGPAGDQHDRTCCNYPTPGFQWIWTIYQHWEIGKSKLGFIASLKETTRRSCIPGSIFRCDNSQSVRLLFSVERVLVSSVPPLPPPPVNLHKSSWMFLCFLAAVSIWIVKPRLVEIHVTSNTEKCIFTQRCGNCSVSVNYYERKSCLELAID